MARRQSERVLAFRLWRTGLAGRSAPDLAGAAACPASDFAHDAALLALAARAEGVSRAGFEAAIDTGALTLALSLRGVIHALAPGDLDVFGRALVGSSERELVAQIGRVIPSPRTALEEVATAIADALSGGRRLAKAELHEALRQRVRAELLPWCAGCASHHVAPKLWRYAAVAVGTQLDPARRHLLREAGTPSRARGAAEGEAARRFLHFYGPGSPQEFAAWAGVTPAHGRRLWDAIADELVETGGGWLIRGDEDALASPPAATGVRLLPPGDPYLQKPNRPLLAPDPDLRKRLFRPVASPGVVIAGGRLAGTWKAKSSGRSLEVVVETLGRVPRGELEDEAERVARLRGGSVMALRVDV